MPDFSLNTDVAANAVNLQLASEQQRLSRASRQLASGLRIESAADDPSGNAVASSLGIHADALNVASQNVRTAYNAAAVGDGALATVTDILMRVRSLAVEAASGIASDGDRSNIQTQIDQLLLEINRISENTSFNGRQLLDGSLAGFTPAQAASVKITSNSVLASTGTLVASTNLFTNTFQPTIYFHTMQAVTASAAPQTVKVSDTQYIQPGSVYTLNGQLLTVQSVDTANGTITAVFSANAASGDVASTLVNGNLTAPVSVGQHVATLSGAPQPLYAGQTLQVDYGSFATNEVVVVQKVLGPNTFVADFTKAHAAGAGVFNVNGTYLPANYGPGSFSFNFGGVPTDGAPIGSTAYVIESTSGAFPPPNGSNTQVVATGTVTGGSVSSTTVTFASKIPDYFGGAFQLLTTLGYGTTPLVNTVDGTIKLQVINTGASVAVQETFYDTATQTQVTSPYLIAPGERIMLYDGVVTTVGNVTAADVGTSAYIKVEQSTAAVTATNAQSLTIHSGADEGETVQVSLPSVSAQALRMSNVTVLATAGNDPTIAAQDTIGQTDYAIETVLAARAQLGAATFRLQEDAQNDDITSLNLRASESSVRDADIGSVSTEYSKAQVQLQLTQSLLSQLNSLRDIVLRLFR